MLMYEIGVYKALADRILGEKVAAQKFKELKERKWTKLAVSEGRGKPKVEHFVWCDAEKAPDGVKIGTDWVRSRLRGSDPEYHAFIDQRALFHVELRFRGEWPKSTKIPSPDDFLWMVLSLLSLEDPCDIPGVADERCISIFPPHYYR